MKSFKTTLKLIWEVVQVILVALSRIMWLLFAVFFAYQCIKTSPSEFYTNLVWLVVCLAYFLSHEIDELKEAIKNKE